MLDALRPPEVAKVLAQLSGFGEMAGDGLIGALRSESEAVRQCAALALGKLQLRRALTPLLELLVSEETPVYAEIARAFGDFGGLALGACEPIPGSARETGSCSLPLANHGSVEK